MLKLYLVYVKMYPIPLKMKNCLLIAIKVPVRANGRCNIHKIPIQSQRAIINKHAISSKIPKLLLGINYLRILRHIRHWNVQKPAILIEKLIKRAQTYWNPSISLTCFSLTGLTFICGHRLTEPIVQIKAIFRWNLCLSCKYSAI